MIGMPGNGEYPPTYKAVEVTTRTRGRVKIIMKGEAYWSGCRWIGINGFRIGYSKVIKWEDKND